MTLGQWFLAVIAGTFGLAVVLAGLAIVTVHLATWRESQRDTDT